MNPTHLLRCYRPFARAAIVVLACVCVLIWTCRAASAGDVHDVTQVGLNFEPPEITVAVGDTVRWTHTGGTHTVTSGDACTFDGIFFDAPLNSQNPVFEYVVPDVEGLISYFCRPHCGLSMVGSITVVGGADPCPEDLDESGDVGFGDVLEVLAAWGDCDKDCPEDLDGSGDVGFGDLLLVLAAWGPCEG